MHKGCSGMGGRLRSVAAYKCRKCTGEVGQVEGRLAESVVISLWKERTNSAM